MPSRYREVSFKLVNIICCLGKVFPNVTYKIGQVKSGCFFQTGETIYTTQKNPGSTQNPVVSIISNNFDCIQLKGKLFLREVLFIQVCVPYVALSFSFFVGRIFFKALEFLSSKILGKFSCHDIFKAKTTKDTI